MTDGREVVEDYRSLQLSFRAHPLTFLRDNLARAGVVRRADLASLGPIGSRRSAAPSCRRTWSRSQGGKAQVGSVANQVFAAT